MLQYRCFFIQIENLNPMENLAYDDNFMSFYCTAIYKKLHCDTKK